MPHLSVVIPVYNGAATLGSVVADCYEALKNIDFELVLVNDGSTDNSEGMLFSLAKQHANIKAISLAKNAGEFNAVLCGLNYATGHFVAIIDDDGQNPPKEILKLLAEAEKGYDVVYAKYEQKQHSWWRNLGSWVNNGCAYLFINKPYGLYLSSFKVLSRGLVKQIVEIQQKGTYLDGLIFRVGPSYSVINAEHKQSSIPSRYTMSKLTATFLSMLNSGGRLFYYFLLFVLVGIGLLFIAVAHFVLDSTPKGVELYTALAIGIAMWLSFLFAVGCLVLRLYFFIKIKTRKLLFNTALKSF